ncbi:MAG: protein kinase [Kofleriaceae bacterium]
MTTTTTERVGRYQLLEPIGVGPSGTVSRAKVFGVAGFERQFAVKRFHAELTTTGALAQALSAAARAYGGLEHPRIARMSEFGVAQGTTFTAVEHVAGLDALRLIAEARLSSTLLAAGGALALVSQAARAVGYAHGRGLTHLGLSPTNVIVTAEGDVKITDFGILAATLPQKPTEVARLSSRIQYLAPEQLANEATSAATDVFALGVLAYELVTGQRTFKGDTPQQIAQSVMAGPPAEPQLPRPIVRVLQRCLARSPFERFPDARALADALDAALRVAPVPGTRKDIGAQVKATLDRLAELHSGELSGVVALNLGTASMQRGPVAIPVATLGTLAGRDSQPEGDLSTTEFVRPDTPVAGPTPLVGPALRPTQTPAELAPLVPAPPVNAGSTMPDLPKIPMTTMTGLAPPPIPVPKGIAGPPPTPSPPSPNAPSTLLGVANHPRPATPPPIPKPPPRPVMGAVPPPKPAPPKPLVIEPSPDGPPPRPSETPVSPLRALASMPTASAAAVPRIPTPARGRPLFGALRPDTDAPDAPRTNLVIETEPGDLPDDRLTTEHIPMAPLASSAVELSAPPQTSAPWTSSDSVEMSIVDGPGLDDSTTLAEPPAPTPVHTHETHEMSPLLVEKLHEASALPTSEVAPLVDEAYRAETDSEVSTEQHVPLAYAPPPAPAVIEVPSLANASSRQYPVEQPVQPIAIGSNAETIAVRPRSNKGLWIVLAAVVVLGLAAAAVFVVLPMLADDDVPVVAVTHDAAAPDATVVAVIVVDATTAGEPPAIDAAKIATAVVDAGAAVDAAQVAVAPVDAGVVAIDAGTKPVVTTSDALSITSTPSGARVFIDGADNGTTPVKLPGTPDRHTIAILLAGHELYVAQVDGHGTFAIPLKEVTPTGGPAGIKVLKCKDKDRYYVFVDGKPTGQTCPTERIETEVGPHVVEVYDVVSETRRKWEIDIKDTRLSYRVKID